MPSMFTHIPRLTFNEQNVKYIVIHHKNCEKYPCHLQCAFCFSLKDFYKQLQEIISKDNIYKWNHL